MYSTGLFTTHSLTISARASETIPLFPFGDVHRFTDLCDDDRWKEWLKWTKGHKRALYLGMGDYMDLVSASERDAISRAGLHETTRRTFEEVCQERLEQFARECSHMRGKLIGLIEGNHYATFPDGTTSTQRLCRLLDCKYLGVSAFVRMRFNSGSKHHCQTAIEIWAHHGKGAARLVGGSLNRVEQMAESADADIFLMGHDHKRSVGTKSRLQLRGYGAGVSLQHRRIIMARTGSFLRGYVPGKASYAADAAMSPLDLGTIKIELTPRRIRERDVDLCRVDVHASL